MFLCDTINLWYHTNLTDEVKTIPKILIIPNYEINLY